MWAELDKLDCIILAARTVMAHDDLVIALSPAAPAIEIDDQEIFLHRYAVITAKISFQRFTEPKGIRKNHVHLFSDDLFECGMFLQRIGEVVAKKGFHSKTSS
jgi:hypothetical protein